MAATDTACCEPAHEVITKIQETWGENPVSRVRPPVGVLSSLGYRVGHARGIPEKQRRITLHYALMGHLPFVDSERYMREWGAPNTRKRYCKIRGVLFGLSESARKTQTNDMERAIAEWIDDHDWFVRKYGHFYP
jgi:hypothetical protein